MAEKFILSVGQTGGKISKSYGIVKILYSVSDLQIEWCYEVSTIP